MIAILVLGSPQDLALVKTPYILLSIVVMFPDRRKLIDGPSSSVKILFSAGGDGCSCTHITCSCANYEKSHVTCNSSNTIH